MKTDYRKFYYLENYLFDEVGPRFRKTGKISPEDFYMILIWKANRAKNRIRDKLKAKSGSFTSAVSKITASLHESCDPKGRLENLMDGWHFRLPTASAILTVLFPNDFSVYDIRVCGELGKFHELADRRFSEGFWESYLEFLAAVNREVPGESCLRDKDRFLWGRSFYKGVQDGIQG